LEEETSQMIAAMSNCALSQLVDPMGEGNMEPLEMIDEEYDTGREDMKYPIGLPMINEMVPSCEGGEEGTESTWASPKVAKQAFVSNRAATRTGSPPSPQMGNGGGPDDVVSLVASEQTIRGRQRQQQQQGVDADPASGTAAVDASAAASPSVPHSRSSSRRPSDHQRSTSPRQAQGNGSGSGGSRTSSRKQRGVSPRQRNRDIDKDKDKDNAGAASPTNTNTTVKQKSSASRASTQVDKGSRRPSTTKNESSSLTFLIVDDSMPTRKVVSRILISQKHSVLEAADGRECVRVVEEAMKTDDKVIDVVLMDDNMPNMSGPEAAKRLRELGYKGLIVAITGNVMDSDVASFKAHGADEVLPKPLDMKALQRILSVRGLLC
jgi:CheY-like chemotaxis protein